jgi:Transposase DDE domain
MSPSNGSWRPWHGYGLLADLG